MDKSFTSGEEKWDCRPLPRNMKSKLMVKKLGSGDDRIEEKFCVDVLSRIFRDCRFGGAEENAGWRFS